MIKFEHTEVVGWEAAIRGMRNPMNSWDKSDSFFWNKTSTLNEEWGISETVKDLGTSVSFGNNDHDLAMRLRNAGTDHRKFMRMINVYVDIIAPLYWWKEMDTYRNGVEKNSCSTMHKVAAREFTLDDFSYEHLDDLSTSSLASTITFLNASREEFSMTKTKAAWWQMIQLLPSSYNQKRTCMISYEALANMYHARKNHKLDEWRDFCSWVETLPYSELITGEVAKND